MVALRQLLPGFLAGEIDPLLSGRVETEHYAYGLSSCENFVPTNEGPIVKRPGFEYICDADASSTWLGAFRFSITQEYAIEWGEAKARFFTNGARIETAPGVAYEIVTPYAAADAPALSTQQSYDRLYIDHASYAPAAISRTAATTFSHANESFEKGPFKDQNTDESITVTASAATGSGITVTASSAIFEAGHVGTLFQIEAKDFSTVKAWEAGRQNVAIGDKVRSDGKVYQAATAGTTGTNPPVHESGSEWDGQNQTDINAAGPYGVEWTYLHDRFGIVTITAIGGGGTTATCDVVRRLPDQVLTVATFRWSFALFSDVEGWPSNVVHWDGRQYHFSDFWMAASVSGDFGGGRVNFQAFTSSGTLAADLAFRRRLATEDPVLWVAADDRMIIGTASRELAIGPINSAAAVSGENVRARPQSRYGSQDVFPVQVGADTVFVERGGRRLRSATYDFAGDRYVATDLTATARHVTKGGIVQMAHARAPHALLYAVRGDGQIVVHPVTRLEVKGFGRIALGGGAKAISVVAVVGADGVTDELWVLAERTRADGVKREIWRQAGWRDLGDAVEDAFFVDAGTSITASGGTASFTGNTHLAGQAIAVLAGGGVVPDITVAADGSFTLPASAVPASDYTLTYGLPFTAEAVSLRPEAKTRNGTVQGLLVRVRKVALRLLETLGLKVGDIGGDFLEEVIDRPGNAAMDAPIPLFTGDTEGSIDAEHLRDGRTRWVSSDPLPAIIAATVVSLEVDEWDV